MATSENLYFSKNGMLKNRVTMLFVFLKWGFRRLPYVVLCSMVNTEKSSNAVDEQKVMRLLCGCIYKDASRC